MQARGRYASSVLKRPVADGFSRKLRICAAVSDFQRGCVVEFGCVGDGTVRGELRLSLQKLDFSQKCRNFASTADTWLLATSVLDQLLQLSHRS